MRIPRKLTVIAASALIPVAVFACATAATAAPRGIPAPLPPTSLSRSALQSPRLIEPQALIGSEGTENWAGYAAEDDSADFRYANANFTVPNLSSVCDKADSEDQTMYEWAGLDDESTIQQAGVLSYCPVGYGPYYVMFTELYPEGAVYGYTVNPGDAIDTSTYWTGSEYQFVVDDKTTGQDWETYGTCPQGDTCANSTAEVITEVYPNMPDFGTSNYTGIAITDQDVNRSGLLSDDWSTLEFYTIGISPLLTPTALTGTGTSFSVPWES